MTALCCDHEIGRWRQHFPGNVDSQRHLYIIQKCIDIAMDALPTRDCINMTNHSYFILTAIPHRMNQILYIASDSITPVDNTYMTTGEMLAVAGTPFDFTTPKAIAPDVTAFENEQVKFGNGFDHNWVLNTKGDLSQVAAKMTSPVTGITLRSIRRTGHKVYQATSGWYCHRQERYCLHSGSVCLEHNIIPTAPTSPIGLLYSGAGSDISQPLHLQVRRREIILTF